MSVGQDALHTARIDREKKGQAICLTSVRYHALDSASTSVVTGETNSDQAA